MTSPSFRLVAGAALTVIGLAGVRAANAQSLERRITGGGNGAVEFRFASRPGVCGDGATFVDDGFGDGSRIFEGGNFSGRTHRFEGPPCEPGPVRVVAWVDDGEVVSLRTYAGPIRSGNARTNRDLGDVPVSEAVAFLTRLAERGNGRVSEKAILPLVLADSVAPWPTLVRMARNDDVGRAVRRTAAFWLSRGASAKLGILDRDTSDDDDVRASAVFALSQQPRSQATPELLDIARTSKRPAVRAQALFWLGQWGDPRAIDLFEEILQVR